MSVPKFHMVRNGSALRISIEEPRTGQTFVFDNAAAGPAEWAAVLLVDKLREEFNDRIREIRREAYESGWKDAKAHAAKQSWFSECINSKCFGGQP